MNPKGQHMQMVYNSDSFAVVQFDGEAFPAPGAPPAAPAAAVPEPAPSGPRGFEIVDKLGRADIYLHGAVAERFQRGAQALMQQFQGEPDVEALDDYIAGFAALGRQPLTLH